MRDFYAVMTTFLVLFALPTFVAADTDTSVDQAAESSDVCDTAADLFTKDIITMDDVVDVTKGEGVSAALPVLHVPRYQASSYRTGPAGFGTEIWKPGHRAYPIHQCNYISGLALIRD